MPQPAPAPILFCTDTTGDHFDPADLFDVAYLLAAPDRFALAGIILPDDSGARSFDTLAARFPQSQNVTYSHDSAAVADVLGGATEPVNVVAVANFAPLAELLRTDRALFREKVARLFLVGGHANDYTAGRDGERLPIDPRLMERHPERFAASGDMRIESETEARAFAELLTSGEGVIWLPRDICLWRYAAPQVLEDGGAACAYLLRELFWANLQTEPDRFLAGDAPVLLSAFPAFLLATQPDPLGWLRLFRAVTVRVEANTDTGRIETVAVKHDRPNAYAVVGIDGAALGKLVTQALRVRPLGAV